MSPSRTNRRRLLVVFAFSSVLLLNHVALAAPPQVTGRLETVQGVRVLKLWGTPEQRGYAHGYLLGRDIVEMFDGAVLNPQVLEDPRQYETEVRGKFLRQMRFSPDRRAELEGMFRGIVDSVGLPQTRLERLGRNLDVQDLMAINSMADWYRFFCSSFSAWGQATADGGMLTARNLDFLALPGLDTSHVIIVYLQPGGGKRAWVSVAWPALIGAYTAMNEDGVTILMHDALGRANTHQGAFVPRSIALRDALESARAATAVGDVKRVLLTEPSITGNNIHVSSPFSGQIHPAAVFEYDGDISADGGLSTRFSTAPPLKDWLVCTNHYCLRETPHRPWDDSTQRYTTIETALKQVRQRQGKIDLALARQIMASVGVKTTFHSVVLLPNSKELYVSLARPGTPAHLIQPVHLRLADLLRK
ncbi:MAG TPA: C45 family peptidase [Phycisphaerae bacterium]|nr:C45 family peptidase [Phycisphaerae bacterium]